MTENFVDVICEIPEWEKQDLEMLSVLAIRAVIAHFGADPDGYLVVVLGCDDKRIAKLNEDFRSKQQPTNVLSWPTQEIGEPALPAPASDDDPTELGDIAISYETCLREAEEQQKTVSSHVTHLLVHATLHLLGYDHEEDDEAELMEATERAILASIGISDPYV